MSYNTEYVNENGEVMCTSCRKKVDARNAEVCVCCDKFICKRCARYREDKVILTDMCARDVIIA